MRTNYITTLTDQTRCRILNDSTTYMASHFFCYSNIEGNIMPNLDFTEVDSVEFNINTTTRKQGTLWVYEGSRVFNDILFLVMSNDGEYKMFYQSDFNLVKNELIIKSMLRNEIYNAEMLELNYAKRERLVVFDSSSGLLANKTDDEVEEFFASYGSKVSSYIAKVNDTLKRVDVIETDYYTKIDNIVFNKRFYLSDLVPQMSTDEYVETERIEVTIENLNFIDISSNGKYIKKGDSIIKLLDKYEKDKKVYVAERYVVKENVEVEEEIMAILKEACVTKLNAPSTFIPLKTYLEDLIKKDIFHLFNM